MTLGSTSVEQGRDWLEGRQSWPQVLLLLVAFLLPTAAAAQGAQTQESAAAALFGTDEWVVINLVEPSGGYPLLPVGSARFELSGGDSLTGTAGCNLMSASFSFGEGEAISFGPVIATRMACREPEMAQERAIFAALAQITHVRAYDDAVVLFGGGYELVLAARPPEGAGSGVTHLDSVPVPDALEHGELEPGELEHGQVAGSSAAAFNEAVAASAAAGASWPSDPVRVALAYVDLRGAPSTIITRADIGAEDGAEDASQTLVTVVEDGFLDDSVAGLEQEVTLERVDGVWSVTSYQGSWRCRRGDERTIPLPGLCP